VQLPTWLSHVVKSGEVTLSTGEVEALQIKAEENKIELNIADKGFLKEVLGSAGAGGSVRGMLAQLRSIAGELKDEGLTVTISYKGDRLVTIGLEAKPTFSQLVTGTSAVEINNMRRLLELIV
jgi:redox-regulated HSP33 family molecular chaperone